MFNFNVSQIVTSLLKLLEVNLPPGLYYHSVQHTKNVISMVERLGNEAGLTPSQIGLLKIDAAGHDVGFIVSPRANEPIGALICAEVMRASEGYRLTDKPPAYTAIPHGLERNELNQQEYTDKLSRVFAAIHTEHQCQLNLVDAVSVLEQEVVIDEVIKSIRSTALLRDEQSGAVYRFPQSVLAQYLLDADLSEFGQPTFQASSELIMRERGIRDAEKRRVFQLETLKMMSNHVWFTAAAKRLFTAQTQANIEWLVRQVKDD